MNARKLLLLLILIGCLLPVPAFAQGRKVAFVDGFHGGVYGHYPLDTYTDFMADQLEAHPGWSICLEIEPETWDSVAVRTPAALARFKALASTDRVEFTNPAYAQPYMYNIYGESIIRQLQYGMDKIREHFPDAEFLTYAVEEPCFTSALPGILGSLGFKYASLKCPNTCWGGYSAPFGKGLVDWTGPDGSTLLAVPRYACEELSEKVWETRANGRYPAYWKACRRAGIARPVGMTYQDAGWNFGPWLAVDNAMDEKDFRYTTWRAYFEQEPARARHETYRMSQEDVRPGLVWGSQVLQRLSRQVRHAEHKLLTTEKTAALLSLSGGKRPDQARLDEAWRTLMLSQHHDCWIVPYNRLNNRGSWADNVALWTEAAEQNCDEVLAALAIPDGKEFKTRSWGIVNTAPFPRTGLARIRIPRGWPERFRIEDADGQEIPYYIQDGCAILKVTVPATGILPVHARLDGKDTRIQPETTIHGPGTGPVTIRTGRYTLTLSPDQGGAVTSLRTRDGREWVRAGEALGVLRGHFYEEGCDHSSSEAPATVQVCSAEGLETRITVRGFIADTPFTEVIRISEDSPLIQFDLEIDWERNVGIGAFAQQDAYGNPHRAFYDTRGHLKLLFPVKMDRPALSKDAPFDVCQSALEDTFFERWDDIKHNVILDWVDLCGSDGHSLALLSDHTTSYTCGPGYPLALTVQYSGNGLWGRDYRLDGPTHLSCAIIPHEGRWDEARIQEQNLSWNEAFTVLPGQYGKQSLLDLSGTGYLLSSLQALPEGCLLRIYNASGDASAKTLQLHLTAAQVREVNLRGEVTDRPGFRTEAGCTRWETSLPRFGFKTFIITTL